MKIVKKIKKCLFSPKLSVMAILFLCCLVSVPLTKNFRQKRAIDQEIEGLKQEMESLQIENEDLGKLLEYLQSDQFVEEQARLNLGLRKPDESVAVIKRIVPEENQHDKTEETGNIILNNWQRWWYYFFK